MTVTVKLNNMMWLLTGRSSGFANDALNNNISVPFVGDTRVSEARRLLKLDQIGTDFFANGALAALYTNLYYIREMDVDHQAAFLPGMIPLTSRSRHVYERDGETIGPGVMANSDEWTFLPFFDERSVSTIRNPINWDAPHDSVLLELDGLNVTVTKHWLGVPGASRVVTIPTPVGNVIQLDASEFAGVRACFDTSSGVASHLYTPPSIYPAKLIRARIADETNMISLMNDAGTIGAFHEASSDLTAVGALAAAIVRVAGQTSTPSSFDVDAPAEALPYPVIPVNVDAVDTGFKPLTVECNE